MSLDPTIKNEVLLKSFFQDFLAFFKQREFSRKNQLFLSDFFCWPFSSSPPLILKVIPNVRY